MHSPHAARTMTSGTTMDSAASSRQRRAPPASSRGASCLSLTSTSVSQMKTLRCVCVRARACVLRSGVPGCLLTLAHSLFAASFPRSAIPQHARTQTHARTTHVLAQYNCAQPPTHRRALADLTPAHCTVLHTRTYRDTHACAHVHAFAPAYTRTGTYLLAL